MNKENLGDIKHLYEGVIHEAPTPPRLPLRPDPFARSREIANRLGLQATARNLAGPNAAIAAGARPTSVTPARPGTSTPANASKEDQIKGGMQVYKSQLKAKDIEGAEETGKNISDLKYGTPEARRASTIGAKNPLMDKTFGYQTGNAPDQQKARADAIIKSGAVAALRPTAPQTKPVINTARGSSKPGSVMSSYDWASAKTIKDLSDAYSSIYEAKKKDQDQDGDEDFADVMIARMMASGMSRAEAIAAVRNKEYNEEYELDEATRMRKELGKEGEIATRKELAARSKAYQRSGSVDKTIAAAERGADRPYVKHKRDESDADRKNREEKQSRTLRGLASSRRMSVRGEGGLRGYAAKVQGSDKELQSARGSARSAGTLTPREKKQLGEEYQIYEILSSYLLENNFAETIDDANVIIENMSEVWVQSIIEQYDKTMQRRMLNAKEGSATDKWLLKNRGSGESRPNSGQTSQSRPNSGGANQFKPNLGGPRFATSGVKRLSN